MISKETAQKLKEAGFPQNGGGLHRIHKTGSVGKSTSQPYESFYEPTLSELIEACGDSFKNLTYKFQYYAKNGNTWFCNWVSYEWRDDAQEEWDSEGSTPEDAVANLWLELNRISRVR